MGEIENIFHNQDINKNILIEFKIDDFDIESEISRMSQMLSRTLRESMLTRYRSYVITKDNKRSNEMQASIIRTLNRIDSRDMSLAEQVKITKSWIRKFSGTEPIQENNINDLFNNTPESDALSLTEKNINSLYSCFLEFSKIKIISSFGYTLSYYKGNIIFRNLYIKSNEKIALKIDFINWLTKRPQITFSSELISCIRLNKEKSSSKNNLAIRSLRLNWGDGPKRVGSAHTYRMLTEHGPSYLALGMFNSIISPHLQEIHSRNIKHVGPLRFQPKRFFLIDNNDNNEIWKTSDGERLSTILHKNKKVKSQINKWFKMFDLEVDIDQIKNIIHSIKVTDRGISLDITDVGFGISQVLPVILQPYLSSDNGLIIIEQPEVHNHPKMQSELADFFISIIKDSNKRFIIETHSEAFLKRLRRRIAEFKNKTDTSISHDDVSIQFIEKRIDKKSSATINNIDISPSGMFDWPRDFKENDIEDSIEFMKLQG